MAIEPLLFELVAGVFEADEEEAAPFVELLLPFEVGVEPQFSEPSTPPLPPPPAALFAWLSMAAALLRTDAYGGGAGVEAGLAVLGGGRGGSDELDVRIRYGFP